MFLHFQFLFPVQSRMNPATDYTFVHFDEGQLNGAFLACFSLKTGIAPHTNLRKIEANDTQMHVLDHKSTRLTVGHYQTIIRLLQLKERCCLDKVIFWDEKCTDLESGPSLIAAFSSWQNVFPQENRTDYDRRASRIRSEGTQPSFL